MWGKPYLGSLFVTFSLLLSSCSSSSDEQTSEIDENVFSARNFMDSLSEQYKECELKYIGESRITTDDLWKSKRWSEVEKYSWIEYSDFIDYYEFEMDDPSFGDYDLADAANAKNCIDFLSSEMTRLEGFSDGEATALLSLYKELFENKTKYLVPAESIVACTHAVESFSVPVQPWSRASTSDVGTGQLDFRNRVLYVRLEGCAGFA